MATQIQWRRGTTAQTASFTGAVGEITVDTDKNTLVVHDNSTVGGFASARESAVTSNAIFSQAAFNTANASFLQANTPSYVANSAAIYANGAFAAANAADSKATSAGSYANSAFLQANTPSYIANSAASYANAAFTRANNSINANTGGTIVGDLNISGNLTVTGFTTYTNTTTLLVADNIITVNAAINQSSQPVVNAGIEVDRGAQPNTSLLWIETSGKWAANNGNGSIFIAADSAETYANGAFAAANAASHVANSAAIYANGAFAQANIDYTTISVSTGTYGNTAYHPVITVAANGRITAVSNSDTQLATIPDVLALSIALG